MEKDEANIFKRFHHASCMYILDETIETTTFIRTNIAQRFSLNII